MDIKITTGTYNTSDYRVVKEYKSEKEVSELARTYGKSHRMCIPPMITDTDMILSEVIERFKNLTIKQ